MLTRRLQRRLNKNSSFTYFPPWGGVPSVVASTAPFHARARGSFPGLGGLKETKMFLPHPLVKLSIVGSLCDRKIACSASDRQGSNFESCVWRAVSSRHLQDILLAQFSVRKSGLKPDSFHFYLLPPDKTTPRNRLFWAPEVASVHNTGYSYVHAHIAKNKNWREHCVHVTDHSGWQFLTTHVLMKYPHFN